MVIVAALSVRYKATSDKERCIIFLKENYMKPTYEELVEILRMAPPRSAINDQRFWDWRRQVEVLLAKLDTE